MNLWIGLFHRCMENIAKVHAIEFLALLHSLPARELTRELLQVAQFTHNDLATMPSKAGSTWWIQSHFNHHLTIPRVAAASPP